MKILIIQPDSIGGVKTSLDTILSSPLLQSHFTLRSFLISRPSQLKESASRISFENLGLAMKQITNLIKVIRYYSPQIVHIPLVSGIAFFKYSLFLLVAKLRGCNAILHLHGGKFREFYSNSSIFVQYLIKNVFKLSNAIVVMGNCWKTYLNSIGIIENIHIIPNTIETEFVKYFLKFMPKDRFYNKNFNILFIGKISKNKGIGDLLYALFLLRKKMEKYNTPQIKAYLVGEFSNTEFRKEIFSRIKKYALQDYIVFTGVLRGKRKIEIFEKGTVLVLPSYYENFPIVLLEAMAAGLPVIATAIGAVPEIIEDNRNGFLISPGDAEKLAEKLLYLIHNKDKLKDMSLTNIKKFNDIYSPPRIMEKWLNLYNDIGSY